MTGIMKIQDPAEELEFTQIPETLELNLSILLPILLVLSLYMNRAQSASRVAASERPQSR